MKRRHYCPPRVLTLKYAATCAETGRRLPAGSTAWYVYSTAKAYGLDTSTAAKLAAKQDGGGADRFDMLYEDACARACGL
jgi:hypothetical protein